MNWIVNCKQCSNTGGFRYKYRYKRLTGFIQSIALGRRERLRSATLSQQTRQDIEIVGNISCLQYTIENLRQKLRVTKGSQYDFHVPWKIWKPNFNRKTSPCRKTWWASWSQGCPAGTWWVCAKFSKQKFECKLYGNSRSAIYTGAFIIACVRCTLDALTMQKL